MKDLRSSLRLLAFGLSLGIAPLLSGCDANLFEAVEQQDPAERSLAYLDEGKPDEAIEVLQKALRDSPEDWTLVSLMASAKAQKAGVDTTDIAIKMATQEPASQGNDITALFTVLPSATEEVVTLLREAVGYISSIPDSERVPADNFKLSIFNTAYTALQAKFFDGNGDGKFTVEELQSLDEDTAVAILESLLNAENAAASYTAGDSTGAAAEKVGEIRAKIDAEPGSSTADKLKSYLAKDRPS